MRFYDKFFSLPRKRTRRNNKTGDLISITSNDTSFEAQEWIMPF